ncbi:MAG: 50S ribosomal protein L35 [Chloroflexi bacterium]|nr:50S ribosomal protein L35 [Chloroflexota bacterium]
MPKQKTHKGAYGRLGITGRGKITRRKGHVNNYRRKKSGRAKGQFDEMMVVSKTVRKRMRRLLPYA